MGDDESHAEITLTVLKEAHIYKLPPRPNAGGWRCQDWPKTNFIFQARVKIVARGAQCTVRLEDPNNGTLFAMCPLDNDRPDISVEPVTDSSRYFVIRVDDGSGRHAFLGMGFLERDHAFEFNVTLQDHVKRLKYEKDAEAAFEAAAAAPPPPSQDFSLKGTISIGIPGGSQRQRPAAAPAPAGGGLALLAPPPPGSSGGGRRPVGGAAPAPNCGDPFGATPAFGVPATDPFGATPFGSSDPFATAPPMGAADPFASGFGTTAGASDPFGSSFGSAPAPAASDGSWVAFK